MDNCRIGVKQSINVLRSLGDPAPSWTISYALMAAGSAFSLLAATGALTASAGLQRGAFYSGIYVSIAMVGSLLGTPYAPRICKRLGVRRTFARVQLMRSSLWVVVGIAIELGAPVVPLLLVTAIPLGFSSGQMSIYHSLLSKAYLGSERSSHAIARMSLVAGLARAVGALIAGQVLTNGDFGWGLAAAGLLSGSMMIPAFLVEPALAVSEPQVKARAWHGAWVALRDNAVLRRTALIGAVGAVFIAPIGSLVVPIAEALRQQPEVTGASYLLSAMSVGALFGPSLVKRLSATSTDVDAAGRACAMGGFAVLLLAAASALLERRVELLVWVIIGTVLGGLRSAVISLRAGASMESGPPEDATANLAAANTALLALAPIGTLAFSAIVGVSAELALVMSGVGTIVMVPVAFRVTRRAVGEPSLARS